MSEILKQMLWLVSIMSFAVNGLIDIESHVKGCLDLSCTKLCQLGVADCSKTVPVCEYGYFLFKEKYCVKCPGFSSEMRFDCMDCLENPTSWVENRQCSYGYEIQNGDSTSGVFQQQNDTQSSLYFIVGSNQQPSNLIDRQVNLPFIVQLCEGCEEFCDDEDDESCNFFEDYNNNDVDPQVGVTCLKGYYFENDNCLKCDKYCSKCDGSGCQKCQKGYLLKNSHTCQECPYGCLDCDFGFDGISIECYECEQDGLGEYYLPSIFLATCETCENGCSKCEYMTYDDTIYPKYLTRDIEVPFEEDVNKYIKRCRQCRGSKSFINSSGVSCQNCNIDNCKQCYQDLGGGTTTLDPDFIPKEGDFDILCYMCSPGYQLSADKKSCTTQTDPDCAILNADGTCQLCANGLMFDATTTPGTCTTTICSQRILNCIDCFAYEEPDADVTYDENGNPIRSQKKQLQCIKCTPGYYPDFFSGKCLRCNSNCKQCWQNTDSYNLTSINSVYQIYSQTSKSFFLNEDLNDPQCTQCYNGYDLYDNECQGCGDGCLLDQVSMCVFEFDTAYCSQCPAGQRSLINDNSDCADCPLYCEACRERTKDEINKINPLFNPSNSDFQRFSNLCYKIMKNFDVTKNLYLDTITYMPTACEYPGTSKKCYYTSTIDFNLNCNEEESVPDSLDLSTIFKGKSSTATLILKEIEKYENYLLLNKNAVQEITIQINIHGTECRFTKPTQFKTLFQQNVFSLLKLNIHFKSSTSATFYQIGHIQFSNINNLKFENIKFEYNDEINSKIREFGITMIGKQSSFSLINSAISKEDSLIQGIFSFNFQGVQTFTLQQVEFSYLQPIDQFLNQNFTQENTYTLTLTSVKFTYCKFINNQQLFDQNPVNKTKIIINDLVIYKSEFIGTNIFGTLNGQPYATIELSITNLKIQISSFIYSNFLISNQLISSSISNVDIFTSQFISSNVFMLNHINLQNIYVGSNKIFNNSIIFSTSPIVDSFIVPKSVLQDFKIINVRCDQNECNSINCLFYLSTPLNTYNVQANLRIESLQIIKTSTLIYTQIIRYIDSALCVFKQFQNIKISKLKSVDNLGSIVFYFDEIKSIDVDTLQCDSIQSDYISVYDEYGDDIMVENPYNNLIPSSDYCAEQLWSSNNYNFYCLYINEFSHGVKLNNIIISNQLLLDFNAIVIQSYDILKMKTTRVKDNLQQFYSDYDKEIIIITNINAFNNTLLAYDLGSQLSLFSIKSQQQQQIVINNAQFQSNHLHKTSLYQMMISATIFVIQSQQATMNISYATFEYNRATQFEYGLNYILVKSINIINCWFRSTNQFDGVWFNKLNENQMNNTIQVWEFFQVKSKGANLYLVTQDMKMRDCQFIDSYGLDGAGMFIVTQGNGNLLINNTIFKNIKANLDQKYLTQGGCLSIDAKASALQLNLSFINMENCVSRSKGGCIWIGSSKNLQLIQITDSKFIKCQSLTSQFMDIQFFDVNNQIVQMSNLKIENNNLKEFLSRVPALTETEIDLFKTSASVYTQTNGQLRMNNIQIFNIVNQNIIYATNLYRGYFNQIQFVNNTIFSAPLMRFTLKDELGTGYLGSITFSENNQFIPQKEFDECTNLFFIIPTLAYDEQTCDAWQENIALVDQIFSDALLNLDELELDDEYLSMTNKIKYEWDEIENQLQPTVDDLPLNFQYDQNVKDCIFYKLFNEISNRTAAYIQILNIRQGNQIKIEGLELSNNNCTVCTYGLLQIIQVEEVVDIITVNYLLCVNNHLSYFGCLSITKNNQLADIQFNKPLFGRRLLTETNDQYSIQVNNSRIISNMASVGAGISINSLNVVFDNCEFSNNIASLVGAGIYYYTIDSYIQIFNSKFSYNQAQVGSAIYLEGTQLSNQTKCKNQYVQNIGTSTYEDPVALTITMNNQKMPTIPYSVYTNEDGDVISNTVNMIDKLSIEKVQLLNYPEITDFLILPSGQKIGNYKFYFIDTMEQIPYDWNMKLVYLNRFGEILAQEYSSDSCYIDGRIQNISFYDNSKDYTSNFTNLDKLNYNVDDSSFNLDELIITFDPYIDEELYLELRFYCSNVKKPVLQADYPYNVLSQNDNYYLILNIKTYPCQMGEAYFDQKCEACDINQKKFSVVPDSPQCQSISSESMLDVTPVGIKLKQGWYRPYIDNDQYEYCLNLPANCNGGWIPGNPSCYTGHIGALCESCDLYALNNDIRYSNTEKYVCSPCQNTEESSIGILAGNTIATVASITLSVKGTYELVNQFLMVKSLVLMGARFNQNANQLATLIKMLTNYFQIIQIVNQFQLVLPKGLTKTTDAAGNPTKSSSFSLDCLLEPMTDINMLYFRMIWALVMPCIYLVIYFVQYFFGVMIGKIPYKAPMITTAFIYMFIFAQPTLVGGFIQLGSSRIISGVNWVQADVAYRSDTDQHQLWVAAFVAPMIVIWVAILPLIFLYRVYTYRFHLNNRHIRSRWGFFYNEYDTSAYYWEFVKIFQKELMVIFLTFYEDYVLIKGALVILVLLYYSWIQINTKPYANNDLNHLDRYSTIVCIITLLIGLLIYTSQEYDTQYLIIIMFVLLGIFNLLFLIQIVFKIFEGYLVKLSDKIDPIRDIILAKKPNIVYQYPSLRQFLKNKKKTTQRVNDLWCTLRSYTKEQIRNRRNNQPKYELINNAPYDFEAAKLPRDAAAAIVPIMDEQVPEYLMSGVAKEFLEKANGFADTFKEDQNQTNQDKKKDNNKDQGFLGGLKAYMPSAVKDKIEKAEKKIDDVKKMKEQTENIVAKGKQLGGIKDQPTDEEEAKLKQNEDEQQKQNEQQQQQGTGGFFGSIKSFMPDSVKDQIKKAEEQQKQIQKNIDDAKKMKDKLEQVTQNKDNLLQTGIDFMPEEMKAQMKKVEEEKRKLEQQYQQAKDIAEKTQNAAKNVQQGNIQGLLPNEVQNKLKEIEEQKKILEDSLKNQINIERSPLDIGNQSQQPLLNQENQFEIFRNDPMRITNSNFQNFADNPKKN
ncbi:unnamed protein product [Paramecium pentaurelia]|uniref:Insulin-like growth factor binding protein, N-terminal n=1 Tax=Paramecium pentaurelia TaxID=43138 RepID=A0A8S1V1V4_9CILI|nr:unnamed protein product [Paramecium pentaurelia]